MEYVRLGDFCEITSSKRVYAHQYTSDGVPFYRSREIIERREHKDITEELYISLALYNTFKQKFGAPQKGDVLLTSVGTLGIPYLVGDEVFYFKDGNLTWMRNFNEMLLSKYLFYWFNSKFGKVSLITKAIGSSQAALTIDILKKHKIFLPSINVQQAIISILSGYDDLIENNNKRIQILEKMAENLYKEWFVRFRFPGHERVEFKKQTPNGWELSTKTSDMVCPATWRYDQFCILNKFKRGKNITAEQMLGGEVPVISAGIEPSGYHNTYNIHGQSITVSSSGANAGYLQYHLSSIWAADCSYCQDDDKLWFLFNGLKFLQPVIRNMQVGAAQPHVYPKHINKMNTIIPDESTVREYCALVEPLYNQIKLLKHKNQNLIKQRELLLPRLMNGSLEI